MPDPAPGCELGRNPGLASAFWLRRPETQSLLAAILAAGHEARVVGGAVRNGLLGLPVTDVDIATTALPEETQRIGSAAGFQVVPTGFSHGTVTVIVDGQTYEGTTLRRDVATFGRHATVAFTSDWAADARRRDFTINAFYCDAEGRLFDPLGGYDDLTARRVRFVGDPDERIREDYLRILRFFRFHAEYAEGPLDRPALDAAVRGRHGIGSLSGERVRQEVLKLIVARRSPEAIDAMADFGILAHVVPVAPRPGVLHRIAAVEALADSLADPILRLAALTVAVEEDAERLADRLRLSSTEREALRCAARRSTLSPYAGETTAQAVLYRLGELEFRRTVLWSWAVSGAVEAGDVRRWRHLLTLADRWPVPKLPVGGRDVLAAGVVSGPAVGVILAAVESWWIAQGFPSDREAVLRKLEEMAQQKP